MIAEQQQQHQSQTSRVIRDARLDRLNQSCSKLWWRKIIYLLENGFIPPSNEVLAAICEDDKERRLITDYVTDVLLAATPPKPDNDDEEKCAGKDYNEDYNLEKNMAGSRNPYLRFINRPPQRAAIWYPMPLLTMHEMSLTQKAEAITRAIASDFVNCVNEVNKDSPNTYNEDTIVKLFDFCIDNHAAHSLCVNMKEMPSIPASVAKAENCMHLSKRALLQTFIEQDLLASKRPKKQFAFNTRLPAKMQYIPPRPDFALKFKHCKNVPKDLSTMETVWNGITNLKTTKGFCQWLLEHPHLQRPQYLVECGLVPPRDGAS